MKTIYLFLIGSLLFFSLKTKAQTKRAIGSMINTEFNVDQSRLTPPDLLPGFFYQIPINNKIAINSSFSFGKKKYYSRSLLIQFNGPNEFLLTQYSESTFSFSQMVKFYFSEELDHRKSRFFGGIGYSLRSPIKQQGEEKTTFTESIRYHSEEDFRFQKKLEIGLGIEYFLDHKLYFALEGGIQTPLWKSSNTDFPILVAGNMVYLNIRVGIHLHKLHYLTKGSPETINIKDLEIKN